MKTHNCLIAMVVANAASGFICSGCKEKVPPNDAIEHTKIKEGSLPIVYNEGGMSLDETLLKRRSIREFKPGKLSAEIISRLLWAGQGETSIQGFRTAPSAGALFPLELTVVTPEAVYHYRPDDHEVTTIHFDNRMSQLADAALGQECVKNAAINIVIFGVVSRTQIKYGKRAERYVAIEAGAAAENMMLEAVSLGLGSVLVGAFDDEAVARIAAPPTGGDPFAIVSIGLKD